MPDRAPRNRKVKGPQPITPADVGVVIKFLRERDIGPCETAADIARANRLVWRAMVTGKLPTSLAFRWIIAGRTIGAQTRELEEREIFERTQKEWRHVHGLDASGNPLLASPAPQQPIDYQPLEGEFIPNTDEHSAVETFQE